ncbi:PREDICTED: uncharacterized protein LOC108618053 [Drosophila arizonae]|uniref:Uncharacterized protein LOC108618053 n=1 Tax=Drosophila arizonae TaxID=7263 RepID=A0ABM1PQG2_DROAR|nr:PREDICTED: uncharacterized protein LOC108618053 [Drosophila arizonae]
MQMYILSPLLLFALYKWGKKAAIGTVILIVLLTVYLFTIMMIKKHSVFFKNQDGSHRLLYFYTHTHAAPWLIGAVWIGRDLSTLSDSLYYSLTRVHRRAQCQTISVEYVFLQLRNGS